MGDSSFNMKEILNDPEFVKKIKQEQVRSKIVSQVVSITKTSLYNHLMSFVVAASIRRMTQENLIAYVENWRREFVTGQDSYFNSFSDESKEVLRDVTGKVIDLLAEGLLSDVKDILDEKEGLE